MNEIKHTHEGVIIGCRCAENQRLAEIAQSAEMSGSVAEFFDSIAAMKHAVVTDQVNAFVTGGVIAQPQRSCSEREGDEVVVAICGGCQGIGSHRRWCRAVVGPVASNYGRWAGDIESIADEIGANNPHITNQLYVIAAEMRNIAHGAATKHQEKADD